MKPLSQFVKQTKQSCCNIDGGAVVAVSCFRPSNTMFQTIMLQEVSGATQELLGILCNASHFDGGLCLAAGSGWEVPARRE